MPTYRVSKTFTFDASHQLSGLPEGHQCSRLHGHTYEVDLELESTSLDETGFVLDYGQMASFKAFIDEKLDHRHLNDVVGFNPTAELLAKYLFDIAEDLLGSDIVSAVRVRETPKTVAEFSPLPRVPLDDPGRALTVGEMARSKDRWAGIRP